MLNYFEHKLRIKNENKQIGFLIVCARHYILDQARRSKVRRENRRDYASYYNGVMQRRLKATSYEYPQGHESICKLLEDKIPPKTIAKKLHISTSALSKRIQRMRKQIKKAANHE